MIQLRNVNKYFNRKKANEIHVINETSLDFPENGIVALLGPSGCGKTTLLNAIGGLDKIHSGKIYVDDECITRRRSGKIDTIRNAKIGYIFQNYNLLDNRTVFDNVAISLRMIGMKNKEQIQERVNYCLKAVGIYPFRGRMADALSGGQRQRVAIARAIAKNPKIIIADEPTGNLDSGNTIEVMNIIKAISKERLVILVTHETEIAEFYADRIVRLRDGKVISDEANDTSRHLDYQLENKIYLKDMASGVRFKHEDVQIDVYQDKPRTADIKIVLRGGNLYINTGGAYHVVDESANIEMIDDHYQAMDSTVYEDIGFKYDEHMPANFKAKYTSVYTPWNMVQSGFRSVRKFSTLKKLLLIGFVFAAAFTFTAVSNIFGIFNVQEKDFLTTNSHYITVSNPKHDESMLKEIRKLNGVDYVMPGDTKISVSLPMDDYYQTSQAAAQLSGSLTHSEELTDSDLVKGRIPSNGHEIVIDRMILDKFIKAKAGNMVGLTSLSQFIGRKIEIPHLSDYTIVGISDTKSPSIFIPKSQTIDVLSNAKKGDDSANTGDYSDYQADVDSEIDDADDAEASIVNYDLRSKAFKIKKGSTPKATYEVVVNNSHNGEDGFTIGKTISKKVNGHKLKLVGFYTSDYQNDIYYVSKDTLRQNYIAKQKTCSVYATDTYAALSELKEGGYSARINYERDRSSYVRQHRDNLRSALVVAGIVLLISLIEIFLMLRSSFLSRIKEVGTLRAIGLKKKDIYRMFSGEILVITVLTSVPGIGVAYYILYNLMQGISYFENQYVVNPAIAVIAFGLLLAFNMLAGLLPVIRTLRKTPAEILARTDI